MKRIGNGLLTALLITLLISIPSMAQEQGGKWAKGTVRAREDISVYAPMGGQLEAFELAEGDDILRDNLLFEVRPTEVIAPYEGVIRIQHAEIGDMAENVVGEYGALCYLEREDVQWMKASTSSAYDDPENRDIRVGEELRIYNNKTANKDKREATGRVVSVKGDDFVVEFPSGIFDVEETIRAYRGSGDDYKDKDRVGKGKAMRVPPIAVAGQGVIADILAEEGQKVSRGQPLYRLDGADTRYEEAGQTQVVAPQDGVLSQLYVKAGQWVVKGQLLLTVTPLDDLECVVDVDETDILALAVGQTMQVKADAKGEELATAMVERIAPLGKIMLDTTKYEVTLRLVTPVEGLLPGMHVTAYWD